MDDWSDRAPLPLLVVRDRCVLYANDAVAALFGVERGALVGRNPFELIALEDHARLSERHARRVRGERVVNSYELAFVRSDGARVTAEVRVAQSGEDTIVLFCDRTDRAARERRLLALARLGATAQTERTREGVIAAVERGLDELGLALFRLEADGDGARIAGCTVPEALRGPLERALGRPVVGLRLPWSPGALAAREQGAAYVDDLPTGAGGFWGEAVGALARALAAYDRGVFVRVDEPGGPGQVLMIVSDWLCAEDLPTLALFGAQVTAALTSVRVIADLSRRNAELAALNRIATLAGTTAEMTELFARGSEAIARTVDCAAIAVYLLRRDEGVAELAHQHGGSDEARRAFARVPLEGTRLGEVARDGRPRVLRREDYPDAARRAAIERMGQRAIVSVPLVVRSQVTGVMNVAYTTDRAIEQPEVELLQAAGAHFAAAIEVARLIADLRGSYAELARAQERLVQRERLAALGELAAIVAHEVRNPLGVIFNALASLRHAVAARGNAGLLLDILAEEAARLNAIVGDLLDFARPVAPALQRGSVVAVLDEAVGAALANASGATVTVERDIADGVPTVAMDARLIRQALLNVALNAVQSMEPGGGALRVRVASASRDARAFVRVELADTGRGIAPDVLPRIFEPFFTTRAKGAGLGLAVVRRIVEVHGGRIEARSAPGAGTTLVIELPVDPPRDDAARGRSPSR